MTAKRYTSDILIIGAGQAGLAAAYFLKKSKKKMLLVDNHKNVGDSWRMRYDSLTFLTPWEDNMLPGFQIRVDPDSYPTKDEYASYLLRYAKRFSMPIHHQTTIKKVEKKQNMFYAYTDKAVYKTKKIIIATGAFHKPKFPSFSKSVSKTTEQLHSIDYKNPSMIMKRTILVVGGGYSGLQIAAELSKQKQVTLSSTKKLFAGNQYDFLYRLMYFFVSEAMIRRIVRLLGIRKIHVQELNEQLSSGKIQMKPRLITIANNEYTFQDGTKASFECIIWATGYKFDYSWIKIPEVFDKKGNIVHKNGISVVDGLYFVYPEEDYGFVSDLPKRITKIVSAIYEK